jgi:hypothetical protein
MAEGIDQTAAQLRPSTWALDAILPFPVESYKKDFKQSAADKSRSVVPEFEAALKQAQRVLELPEIDDPAERDRGYARLGNFLIRQVDLLVAVWNGERAGGPGGTADVIREAIRAGVPVVWVPTTNVFTSHGFFARLITEFERDGKPVAPAVDCTKGSLAAAIASIVSVPKFISHTINEGTFSQSNGPPVQNRLTQFLKENWPRPSRYTVYDLFKRLTERRPLRLTIPVPQLSERLLEWEPFFKDAPSAEKLEKHLREILLPRYIWADQLATDFASKYRTAYILCYLLAASAVTVGVAGLVVSSLGWDEGEPIAVIFELILLAAMGVLYRKGENQRWHEKWLEYRALAEMLRDSRFLSYLGEYGRIQHGFESLPASSAWFAWYLRVTIRELGLPDALLDGAYQDRLLGAVEEHVVAEQLGYHNPNARTLAKMDAWLHRLMRIPFFIVISAVLLFLLIFAVRKITSWPLDSLFWSQLAALATFLAAILPAWSAAFAGIRETGDFEGFAQRSELTARQLEELQRDSLPAARKIVSLNDTASVLTAAAQILTEDLATWQSLYGRKKLDLRA